MRLERPFHTLTAFATMAHHAFELGAGVGLVFQPQLGLAGSSVLWGAGLPAWAVVAARGRSTAWEWPLGFAAGMSLGGAALHYVLWPWVGRAGLPYLTQAEGLRDEQMPWYNAILYAWAAAAGAALVIETPKRARAAAAVGFAVAMALRGSARHHFEWVREQARARPAWWNRAVA